MLRSEGRRLHAFLMFSRIKQALQTRTCAHILTIYRYSPVKLLLPVVSPLERGTVRRGAAPSRTHRSSICAFCISLHPLPQPCCCVLPPLTPGYPQGNRAADFRRLRHAGGQYCSEPWRHCAAGRADLGYGAHPARDRHLHGGQGSCAARQGREERLPHRPPHPAQRRHPGGGCQYGVGGFARPARLRSDSRHMRHCLGKRPRLQTAPLRYRDSGQRHHGHGLHRRPRRSQTAWPGCNLVGSGARGEGHRQGAVCSLDDRPAQVNQLRALQHHPCAILPATTLQPTRWTA